jgi:cell division protein FtsL
MARNRRANEPEWTGPMGRVIGFLLILIVLAAIGLVAFSYSGFMQPDRQTVTEPVDLGLD